jgi:quercetin dioxygenase-like cupin family protein
VELVDLLPSGGRPISAHGSTGLTAEALIRAEVAAVTVLRVRAGGSIGRHRTVADQLLLVVAGRGAVRAGDGPWVDVKAGQVVLWWAGEEHTTRASEDVTAFVLEADDLFAGRERPAAPTPPAEPVQN